MISRQRKEIPSSGSFDAVAVQILNETRRGRTNNGGVVTLTANSATTTLRDPLITRNSVIHFTPRTANAKSEGMPYYDESTDLSPGEVVLHHTNAASSDRSFLYSVNC